VEGHIAPEEREREAQRRARLVEHEDGRQALGHDLRPVLVLEAGAVDALVEVALPVEQADADHRQREVARLLQDVARERAETTRVDRQRRMDPELRADEDDGPVDARDGRLGPGAVLLEHALEAGDALQRRPVPRGQLRGVRREVGQLAHRVLGVDHPRVGVERAEERRAVRIPGPAVVERDPRERRELGRQSPGELRGPLVGFPRARERRDIHDPGGAHGRST
jgi:hypothetical protein